MPSKTQTYTSDNVLEEFYTQIYSPNAASLPRVHIPRSDVFYVRQAVEAHFGESFSLDRIERAMYLEGMLDKSDVFEPDRDWEYAWDTNLADGLKAD
jgi:hypothetical protein